MYLHLGEETVVRLDEVVGVFDLENTTVSKTTRDFLTAAQQRGEVVTVSPELPKSFVICRDKNGKQTVYISQISCATLLKRTKQMRSI